MTDETPKEIFVDLAPPHELVINRVINTAYFGSQVSWVLGGARIGVGEDGQIQGQSTILARLRFDLEMAVILRNSLDAAIATLTAPKDVKAN